MLVIIDNAKPWYIYISNVFTYVSLPAQNFQYISYGTASLYTKKLHFTTLPEPPEHLHNHDIHYF